MHCEFSVTTDCQPARSKTFFALRFSQIRYCARRGRASARQVIVQDWPHFYDVARNVTIVLMMFRQWLLITLLQLTSHCSSEFSTTNFTCSTHCCLTRLSVVINYAVQTRQTIIRKSTHLSDSLLVVRMLYKDSY